MPKSLRILFIAGSPTTAETAEQCLGEEGIAFVSRIVEAPASLTSVLASFHPDVVVADCTFPGIDGVEVLHAVRALAPGTPFLVLAGSGTEAAALACLRAGADDYVLQEYPARLGRAVLSALEKHRARREMDRAIAELRASEELFRALIENSSEGVSLVTADAILVYASPSALRVLGHSRDDIIGRNAFELVHPDDVQPVRDLFFELLADPGTARSTTFRARHADGSWRWVEGTARNALNEPAVKGIVLNFRDVTGQHRVLDALRQSEEKYRLIADSTSDGIFTLDLAGRFTFVSPRWLALSGLEETDVLGRHFEEFILPNRNLDIASELFSRGLAGEDVPLHEVDIVVGDRILPVELSTANLRGPQGELSGRVGVFRDITERKRADGERRRLATALEQAAESIMITDTEGLIQYVNPAFERISGYSRDEAIGRKPSILKSGEQNSDFYAALWQTIKRGENWQGRMKNRRKDGTLFEEEATISPIRSDVGEIVGFVAVKRDITQEIALEVQLRQAQKMEAVGNLAGGVAHDFNNLLQALMSQIQLLRTYRNQPAKVDTVVGTLEQQVKRGASLTRQLLLFSRREIARLEIFDLNEVLRGTLNMLKHLLRENVRLEIRLAAEPLVVEADRGEMEQILMNLVVNAADAMPDGGRLEVHTLLEDSQHMCLTVTDTGHGIPESIRHRIFEPFFTTKEAERGTGLGLSVVHGIISKGGGTIDVISDGAVGTTFRIVLPLAARPATPRAAETVERRPFDGRGRRLLLVEDEAAAREGLQLILEEMNFDVTAVRSGEDAEQLSTDRPFQVLLSDMMLPGISGVELARRLGRESPGLKIILMSGHTEGMPSISLSSDRPVGYLQKPFDMHTLANEIRSVLAL